MKFRGIAAMMIAAMVSSCSVRPAGKGLEQLGSAYSLAGTNSGGSLIKGTSGEATIYRAGEDIVLAYPFGSVGPVLVQANEVIISGPATLTGDALTAELRARKLEDGARLEVARQVTDKNIFLVRVAGSRTVLSPQQVLEATGLAGRSGFSAEANSLSTIDANQDRVDPRVGVQWAYQNVGPQMPYPGGTADADIDGTEALADILNRAPPTKRPVVAVLDTGLFPNLPAMKNTEWTNAKEIPGNSIDDDKNGFVDDVKGWDFFNNIPDPWDLSSDGHGTHVAGIIGSRPDTPGKLPYGIAPWSIVMPLKVLKPKPTRDGAMYAPLFAQIEAITYASRMGAEIANMSYESYVNSPIATAAIMEASNAGMLLVAAAGNGLPDNIGKDVMQTPVYPCVITVVICVAATDTNDKIARFSNFGMGVMQPNGVDIAAPGVDILSLGRTATSAVPMSGTSMASPMVAGVLAMLKSAYPGESNSSYLARLLYRADVLPGLKDKVARGGRLNAYYSLLSRPGTVLGNNEYCSGLVTDGTGQKFPRWQNAPFANSGEGYADGKTYNTAFAICTAQQLLASGRSNAALHYRLRQDIDWSVFGGNGYPLGDEPRPVGVPLTPYVGQLHGEAYAITGLRFRNRPNGALIAHLAPTGLVEKLYLRGVDIEVSGQAAGVAAISEGKITGVSVEGHVKGDVAGGLVAEMRRGTLSYNFSSVDVAGTRLGGGIVGSAKGMELPLATISNSKFEGVLAGSTVGGIAALAEFATTISRTNAVVFVAKADIGGGLVGRLGCGANLDNSFAEGQLLGSGNLGGMVGVLVDANVADGYSTVFFNSGGTTRGGAVGKVLDGQRVGSSTSKFVCTGSNTRPPPSTRARIYYDTLLSSNAAGGGTGLKPADLRSASKLPATWFAAPGSFRLFPGFMPSIKPGLPRSPVQL